MNLTPMWRKVAIAPLVHCTTLVFNEPPRSYFACLAGERALRLGRAALSAPPHTLCAAVQREKILSSPPKRKIRNTQMGIPYFWRRRKDLNLRAGYPTYTLSRGASSPLEYVSRLLAGFLMTCLMIISAFSSLVNRFY